MINEDIRKAVLEAMNAQRQNSRHEHEIRMHISQIERAVRKTGVKASDKQVMQSVDYLKTAGMLNRTSDTKTVKMPATRNGGKGSSFKHTDYWYTLTVKAIDKLEGETEYSHMPFVPFQTININTSNAPVIVGSNNLVSSNVTIFSQLDELQQVISESTEIDIEERQDAVSDIEGLKQQLAKPNPNSEIIGILWKNIGRVADLAGAGALAVVAAKAIAAALGHPIS